MDCYCLLFALSFELRQSIGLCAVCVDGDVLGHKF